MWCRESGHPTDFRQLSEVQVGPEKLEMVVSFCYLGNMLSAGGGCELVITTCVKMTWKKFRELLQFSHPTTSLTRSMAM